MPRDHSSDILCNNYGEWVVDWLYNKVTIIGQRADIRELKKLCIRASTVRGEKSTKLRFALERIMPTPFGLHGLDRLIWRNDTWGTDGEPWNVEIDEASDPWTLIFSFESTAGFPEPVFRVLEQRFPRVSFYCFSREFNDFYLEIGWFNTPPGCYDFHEEDGVSFDGPDDGTPRDPVAHIRHERTMATLKKAARDADEVKRKRIEATLPCASHDSDAA